MRSIVVAAALAAFVGAGAAPVMHAQQAPTAESVMRRAVAAYEKVRTVDATFEQTIVNPLTGTTAKAAGVLRQRRPNQLAVRFTDPAGDVVISDGKAVWVYLPSSAPKQVLKLPIGTNAAGALDLAAQFLEEPEQRYRMSLEGTETLGGFETQVLSLVPRVPMQFTAATVWVDGEGVIRQLRVTEGSGVVRTVRFTKLRLNVPVPASAFAFTPPAGVKVFDQSGRGSR
jgi:outer membrane lipoprotein carrier protein